jgi:hypothetical protein
MPRSGRALGALGSALALFAGCGGGQRVERSAPARAPATSSAEPASNCALGRVARARASEHLREDRRLAARKAIEAANRLCPEERAASLEDEETLRSLIDPRGPATVDAAKELLDEARRRRGAGDSRELRLLEERAIVLLERALARALTVALPSGSAGETGGAWTGAADWLLLYDRDGVSVRRRGEWYPEFFSAKLPERADEEKAVLVPSGRWLLVPVAAPDALAGQKGPGSLVPIGLKYGGEFGREGPRLSAETRAPWALSPDGSKLVFAEPGRAQTLAIADTETLTVRHRIPAPAEVASLESAPLALGNAFALAQWQDGSIAVAELATGRWVHFRSSWGALAQRALSPDERYAVWRGATGKDRNTTIILDTASCAATCTLREVLDPDCTLWADPVFDAESRTVVVGSENSLLCLVELASGRVTKRLKLQGQKPDLARPYRFTKDGKGLLAMGGGGDLRLFDVKRGRELALPIRGAQGALRSVLGKPAIVSGEGIMLIGADLRRQVIKVDTERFGWPVGWTSLDSEVLIKFQRGWSVLNATTGATQELPFPPYTRIIENDSHAWIANVDGPLPEVFARETWQRVTGSPRFFATLGKVSVESGELVFGDASRERRWSVRAGLRSAPRSETGANEDEKQASPEEFWSSPPSSAGEARLLKRSDEHGKLVVWDVASERSIGELPLEPYDRSPIALSPGDRFVSIGPVIWDLPGQRKLAELAGPVESAAFFSDAVLAVTAGARLTLYAGPRFSPALALFAAREADAAVAFAFDEAGAVSALETFGPADVWDTTFACGVEPFGLSFGHCRSVFATTGLLESVLGR